MREELEDVLELYAGMPPAGQQHWRARSLPSVDFHSDFERDEFLRALAERDKPDDASKPGDTAKPSANVAPTQTTGGAVHAFAPGQRVKANLAGLHVGGVHFSQNVETVYATIERRISDDPPIFRLRLLISFRGVDEIDVPADRLHPM
ncbi:MAG: hypothetical protein HUU22_06595 [Phycisphaerae bacterium]|nr:hypothetical protein [Phycisphaerae bacterium]NUQ45682.1 hypothetical protein [Phycisphaerae bacterium]